jgi:cell wall-associated NlpC family hydrolase
MVVHSHVYIPPIPSEADKVGCEQSQLPWLIVNHPVGTHTITYPSGYKAPLIGRCFKEGLFDCYALVKDYFAQERDIALPDCERPAVWFEVGVSILTDNFKEFGFVEISEEDLQPGDCLLMRVGASVPNHCAVYLDDNIILHHVKDRLSGREVFGTFWRRATTHYLRYAG